MKFSLVALTALVAAVAALPQGQFNPPPPVSDPPSTPGGPPFSDDPHKQPDPVTPDPRTPTPAPRPDPRNNGFNLKLYRSAWSGFEGKPLIINGDSVSGLNYLMPGDWPMTFQLNSGFLHYGGERNDGSVSLWGGQSSLAVARGFTPFILANSNGFAPDRRGLNFWNTVSLNGMYLTVDNQARWAMCYFNGKWVIGWVDDSSVTVGRDLQCYSTSIVGYNQFNGGPRDAWKNNAKKTEGKKMPNIV